MHYFFLCIIPAAQPMIPSAPITAAGAVPAFVAVGVGETGAVTGRVDARVVVPCGEMVLPEGGRGINWTLIDWVLPVLGKLIEVVHCS